MAVAYNFDITQGTSLSVLMTGLDSSGATLNLNNYTISGNILPRYGASGNLVNLTLTTGVAVSGLFTTSLTPAQTAALYCQRSVYNINATKTSDNSVIRLYDGYINVVPQTF